LVYSDSPNKAIVQFEKVTESPAHRLKDLDPLGSDLGADAVAGE
jgi:hypothetical protein